jgi:hypothetical protein
MFRADSVEVHHRREPVNEPLELAVFGSFCRKMSRKMAHFGLFGSFFKKNVRKIGSFFWNKPLIRKMSRKMSRNEPKTSRIAKMSGSFGRALLWCR